VARNQVVIYSTHTHLLDLVLHNNYYSWVSVSAKLHKLRMAGAESLEAVREKRYNLRICKYNKEYPVRSCSYRDMELRLRRKSCIFCLSSECSSDNA